MPRFCANLSLLYNELPFLDRFAAAAKAGFTGVEYLFPYDFDKVQVSELLHRHKLRQVLHNLPAGDWAGVRRETARASAATAECSSPFLWGSRAQSHQTLQYVASEVIRSSGSKARLTESGRFLKRGSPRHAHIDGVAATKCLQRGRKLR